MPVEVFSYDLLIVKNPLQLVGSTYCVAQGSYWEFGSTDPDVKLLKTIGNHKNIFEKALTSLRETRKIF